MTQQSTNPAALAGVSERRVHAWLAGTDHPSPTAEAKITAAHHDYYARLQDQLATALRSRSRPVVLSAGSDQDVALVAALAAVLQLRGRCLTRSRQRVDRATDPPGRDRPTDARPPSS